MAAAKYLKEPGYMYDLFYLFILNFNKDVCLENYLAHSNEDDAKMLNRLYDEVQPVSQKILPFFFLKEKNMCFMSLYYFHVYESKFTWSYDLSFVMEELKDCNRVIEQMIRFYFPDVSEEDVAKCKGSFESVAKLIEGSNYNEVVQNSLYSFFINPERGIQHLIHELISKDNILKQKYEKNLEKILDFNNGFSSSEYVSALINHMSDEDVNDISNVYVSFCLCNPNAVIECLGNEGIIFLLGDNYKTYITEIINRKDTLNLDEFGNVLSEPNRIEILNLMADKGEVSIRDVEQALGFTGTNAYYHLSLMIRTGMLVTRNKGRTIYYALNEPYFAVVAQAIQKYYKKER